MKGAETGPEKRVMHTRVITHTGGGPDKTILNSPRFLVGTGYSAFAAYMHPPDDPGFEDLGERAIGWRCDLLGVPDRGPWDLSVIWRLWRLCRKRRVDIWHGHDYKSNLFGVLLKPFHRMHLVSTVHGWGVRGPRTDLYYALDRWALRRYDRVICVSLPLLDTCVNAGVPREKTLLIENAIDTDEFRREKRPGEARRGGPLAVPAGRLVVGAMGRLSAEKNFLGLVRALDSLVKKGHDLELWIVGEGPERTALESEIARSAKPDRVRLLGYRRDNRQLLEQMDLFVLSSTSEGLPNVILEALSMETPIVSTRVGAVPDILMEEETALLCMPGDDHALETALERMVCDSQLRIAVASAGRALAENRFSFSRRMEKIRAVYGSLETAGD